MAEDSAASTRVGDYPAHRDRIIERLVNYGIPMHQFGGTVYGLVDFVGRNKSILPDVVYALLPTEDDISNYKISSKMDNRRRPPKASMNALFAESFLWIQWLMFKKEPQAFLKNLEESCAGHRAVCGAVWGSRNLAYKCRTCQHDPTCAICVPCFQNGNHDGHDISIIYVSGGCCDCGDASAWKPQGFCSKHGGLENIQPLSPEIADSLGPILEALFHIWNDKLSAVQRNIFVRIHNEVQNALSNAITELLLEFCSCSESLLSFTSSIMCGSIGLLDLLIRSELFLAPRVCQKIHDLLLKLLAEPRFKIFFAKAFIKYYEYIIHEDIKKNDSSNHERYPLMMGLSVQIFTVPTLTLLLVQENNLLGVLFSCLEDLLISCTSGHSCLQMSKWINLYQATINLVSDIIYVVRDKEVCKYIANKQPEMYRAWFRILSLVQGMEPQIRVTNHPSEDPIDNHDASNELRKYLDKVQKRLIVGALFSFTSCADNLNDGFVNDEEIKTTVQNNSKCFSSQMSSRLQVLTEHVNTYPIISSTVKLLISECLEAIENWLSKGTTVRIYLPVIHDVNKKNNLHNLEKGFLRKPTSSDSTAKLAMHHECCKHECPITTGEPSASCKKQKGENLPCSSNSSLKKGAEIDNEGLAEGQSTLGTIVWPDIVYDVSSQEVSFHIPMHRFLCVLLQRTMEFCYGGSGGIETAGNISAAASHGCQFFENVLDGFHMDAVSAYLMEHPLSLWVYCAQVHAGMWRKNGETSVYLAEHYRSVHGCQSGIEIDLFLLQCCAALAPPDLFVTRILERFGLSRYLSLDTSGKNEYVLWSFNQHQSCSFRFGLLS